jgi:hypothetical protein
VIVAYPPVVNRDHRCAGMCCLRTGRPAWGCPVLTDRFDVFWSCCLTDLSAVVVLVVGGAAVAEGGAGCCCTRRCTPRSRRGLGAGGPGPGLDQRALEGGEERLGDRVVPALALAPDQQHDLLLACQRGERGGGVLAAPVGVEDHVRLGVACRDRVGERVRDQFGAQVIGEGIPDDAAGGDAGDGGQVEPSFPGAQVGDVPAPAGVNPGSVRGEVPPDRVRPLRRGRVSDRGLLPGSPVSSARRPWPA